MLRRLQQELGRPLTEEERDTFESAKFKMDLVAVEEMIMNALAVRRETPLAKFIRKLMARQGTIPPDFEALYKKKAELDRKLLGEQ